jgi:hypothetical protein
MRYRPLLIPLALSSAFAASGCTGLVAAGSVLGAVGAIVAAATQVAGAVDPVITTACREYDKGKAAADALIAAGLLPANVTAKIRSIEAFGDATCANPPQGDAASTVVWLGQLIGELAALTGPAQQSG